MTGLYWNHSLSNSLFDFTIDTSYEPGAMDNKNCQPVKSFVV